MICMAARFGAKARHILLPRPERRIFTTRPIVAIATAAASLLAAGVLPAAGALAGLPTVAPHQAMPVGAIDFHAPTPDLHAYISRALKANPTILEARARYEAARQHAPQVLALPDPIINLTKALRSVETRVGPQRHTVTLTQAFPWLGTRQLRGRVAQLEAAALHHVYLATGRNLVAQVKETHYASGYTDASLRRAAEEQSLLEHYDALARARYATGQGLQQAVTRLQAEISRVLDRRHLLGRERQTLVVRLNTLLDRPVHETVPAPERLAPVTTALDRDSLYQLGDAHRHELQAAAALVEMSERSMELAKKRARPGFTASVGVVDVGLRDEIAGVPPPPDNGRNAVTLSLGMSLPVWGSGNRGAVQQAHEELRAQMSDQASLRNVMEMEVQDALVRIETLQRQLDLFDTVLIPQTEEGLRATEGAYETGQLGVLELLDSERTLIDVRLTRARYASDLLIAFAALERAVGTRVPLEASET